jgi:KDO2-lipid IV(A) lauroyltransferase
MGARILYYLLLKPISWLPYFILYRVSDFIYLLFSTVFPYRKKVVEGNLERCFPEKSPRERRSIRNAFYRHLADVFVESFKNFSITKKQIEQRFVCTNPGVLDEVAAHGQGIVLAGGHYNNWELYAMAAADHFTGRTMAIYKRIKNPWFDKKMRETRGKYGLELVPTIEASEWMRKNAEDKIVCIYAIDQSPANPTKAHWINFMGQRTAAYYGPEKHARQYSLAVVYGHINKVKRGHYTITYEKVTSDVEQFANGALIERLNAILEQDIRRAPEFWLWSHKRWKHKEPLTQTASEHA